MRCKASFIFQSTRGSGCWCIYMSTYENIFMKNTRLEGTNSLLLLKSRTQDWADSQRSGILTGVKAQLFPLRSKRPVQRRSPISITGSLLWRITLSLTWRQVRAPSRKHSLSVLLPSSTAIVLHNYH